jgi:hypothetical protein
LFLIDKSENSYRISVGEPKENIDYLEYEGADLMILLKWILKNYGKGVWTGYLAQYRGH